MADKTISQIVSKEGKPVAPATSAPGCFIQDGKPIPQHPDLKWGKVFSEPRSGNDVDFYVTGSEYFDALTAAIASAKKSIYITGWQVNFDVELQPGKTMYQLLEKAIDDHPELHIYAMPWLSPKVGQDTGDFETMLAVFQLNAGLKPAGKVRAFAMPAIAQSDMTGGMGIFFSHHQKLIDITSNPHYEKHAKRLGILGVAPEDIPGAIRWSQVDDVRRDVHGKGADFMNDLHAVLGNIALIKTTQSLGRAQKHVLNPMGEALARRIESAIFDGLPFHVYMVLPVYPEGTLNTLNIMTQVHLTMQSLVFGSNSLVNRIRRAVVARQLMKKMNVSAVQAKRLADSYYGDELAEMAGNQWEAYLTLLNLRNWQTLQGRPVTEQVYVHSKLLIADDRVAIIGTANINDRSQLGDRDSEIAVTIRDDAQTRVKLDGKHEDPVSTSVHHFRRRLWSKLFGLMGGISPAEVLAAVIDQPAASATWEAIQKVAQRNAAAYDAAFKFVPKVANASSIWPCWDAKRRKLVSYMPFNEQFWRAAAVRDTHFTWDAEMRGQESVPAEVKGYIVALPLRWTEYENNLSGINLSLMAANDTSTDNLYTGVGGKSDSEHVPTADSGGNLPRSTITTTSKGAT